MKPVNRFKMAMYLMLICIGFVALVYLVSVAIPFPYSGIFYLACVLCLILAFILWSGFLGE